MADNQGGGAGFVAGLKANTPDAARSIKLAAGLPARMVVPEAAVAAAMAQTLATKPGKERWPVKTGTDPDVGKVGANGIVDTTVEEMRQLPLPSDMQPPTQEFSTFQDQRSEPVETTVWRLTANVIELKREADGDYHLVLQGDSGETMIGEVPTPRPPFVAQTSPFLADIATVRAEIDDKLVKKLQASSFVQAGKIAMPATAFLHLQPAAGAGAPGAPGVLPAAAGPPVTDLLPDAAVAPPTFKTSIQNKRATFTGVGFFDRVHGQDGVSLANGIELHPILKVEWVP